MSGLRKAVILQEGCFALLFYFDPHHCTLEKFGVFVHMLEKVNCNESFHKNCIYTFFLKNQYFLNEYMN